MLPFKSKFSYTSFAILILALTGFIFISAFYFTVGFPLISKGEKHKVPMYFGLGIASLGLVYANIYLACLVLWYRFQAIIYTDRVVIKDKLFQVEQEIELWYMEGYLETGFVLNEKFESLDLVLKNGKRFRFLKFTTSGLDEVAAAFTTVGLKELKK